MPFVVRASLKQYVPNLAIKSVTFYLDFLLRIVVSKHRPFDESSFKIDEDFLAFVDSIEDNVILYKINKRPRYLAKALNKASIEVREAIET